MINLQAYRVRTDQLLADHRLAERMLQQETDELVSIRVRLGHINQAQEIAQSVAQVIQQRAHNQIASVVTRSLEAVFDNPYTFSIRFDRKRGKTEAVLILERDGEVYENPLQEVGGGVVDVVSMVLRLSCVLLSQPHRRRLLLLDEPFRFLAKCYRPRARAMMEQLAEDLEFQIIWVTHMQDFTAGKVVEIGS